MIPHYQTDYDLGRLKAMGFSQISPVDTSMRARFHVRLVVGDHRLMMQSNSNWRTQQTIYLDREYEWALSGKDLRVILHVTPSRRFGLHLVEVIGHPEYPVDRPLHLRVRTNGGTIAGTEGASIDEEDTRGVSSLLREFVAKVDAHRAGVTPIVWK